MNTTDRQVLIYIDETELHSPDSITADELYALGNIKEGLVLYREVEGAHVDPPISRGPHKIELHENEHFHSGPPHDHVIEYEVNGEPQSTKVRKLTPIQIMENAGIDPAKNYLIQIVGSHQEPYKDTPDKIIHMHDNMKFITNFIGPKPVSCYGSR